MNPFARGAGIAAIALLVISGVFLIAQNNQLDTAIDYELAVERVAILSWWVTFTFVLAIVATFLWTLLSGIQWIAVRVAPGAFAAPVDSRQGMGEAEVASRYRTLDDTAPAPAGD